MKVAKTRTTAYLVRRWNWADTPQPPLWWTGQLWSMQLEAARPYTTRAVAEQVAAALGDRYRIVRTRVKAGTVIHDGD